MSFRTILFWTHLVVGVAAGLIVALMALTGSALAFEKELVAWSERDARRIAVTSPGTSRLAVDDLLARVREQVPGGAPSSVTVYADPSFAAAISYGRTNTVYADPFSGRVCQPGSRRLRDFMQLMLSWHRWLGREGERRDVGKAVTGVANLAFLGLALSGLYLWWPRQWTLRHLRVIAVPSLKGQGKARDWNWHNAFGLWAAPVLIVLTATAVPISYRWGGDLIYALTRTPRPAGGGAPGPGSGPAVEVPTPAADARPLALEQILTGVREQIPNWEQMTLRLTAGDSRGGGARESRAGGGGASGAPGQDRIQGSDGRSSQPAGREARVEREQRTAPTSSPVMVSVKEIGGRPRFASHQLTLDPFTGAVLRQERFADLDRARQLRSWTRFLHTGEALGPLGQAVAGLASLATGILVWTGLALTWRRWMRHRATRMAPTSGAGSDSGGSGALA